MEASLRPRFLVYFLLILQLILLNLWPILFHLVSEVEAQLGNRLQASVVRQMKASEMATQWTLLYHLTSRLRVLLQSAPSKRLFFEYYVKQLLKNQ
ncbi:hypothetical protein POPTR_006G246401v4 [Populus trichocarpa]|uniref:Uncharacterized protein n=1 Tax=Populus trichocarpa TaxID=3694 RepID=A0ACC0SWA3_POPTR|nr:hypothetical protein POPTR_006G246401v4 [Populus trichocarpa]